MGIIKRVVVIGEKVIAQLQMKGKNEPSASYN